MKTMTFPFSIDDTGKVSVTTNTRKIWLDRVRAVISTEIGQRPMRSSFGTATTAALFGIESGLGDVLTEAITAAFSEHLSALSLESVDYKFDTDSAVLTVDVLFNLPDSTTVSTSVEVDGGSILYEQPFVLNEA